MNRMQAINVIDGLGTDPEIVIKIEQLVLEMYRKHGLNILRDDAVSAIATKMHDETGTR